MTHFHKDLAEGRWRKFTLVEQMANIGSEVYRTLNSRKKNDEDGAKLAFERALELFDLTLQDPKNRKRLKEVARSREIFVDYFMFDNEYKVTDESLNNYYLAYGYAARL